MLKRLFIIASLTLALAGCAGTKLGDMIGAVQSYTVTQGQLDAARTTYNGTVLAPLRRYAKMPTCAKGQSFALAAPCHDPAMLKRLSDADMVVAKQFNDTQDMITSGNNSGSVAAYKTLQSAIDVAKSLLATSGASML